VGYHLDSSENLVGLWEELTELTGALDHLNHAKRKVTCSRPPHRLSIRADRQPLTLTTTSLSFMEPVTPDPREDRYEKALPVHLLAV
jgi:hypothetical protein